MNIKQWMEGARHSMTMKVNASIAAVGGAMANVMDLIDLISKLLDYAVPAARTHLFEYQSVIDPELFKTIGTVLMIVGLVNIGLRARTSKPILERKPEPQAEDPAE